MFRYKYVILFLLVLVTPFVLRAMVGRTSEAPVPADALELIVISPHGEPIRREFEQAFSAWHEKNFHKAVDINYLSFGGGADIRRTLDGRAETLFKERKTYDIDLVWGGGDDLFDRDLKPHLEGLTIAREVFKAAYPNTKLAGLKLVDDADPPKWFGTALSSFGISYNRDVVRHLGRPEPKTWRDLADPKFCGWIVMADPTRSSSAKAAFMIIVERAMADAAAGIDPKDKVKFQAAMDSGWADGMGLIRQISANARNFNDGSQSIPGTISSGDVAAGMTIDFYAHSQISFVGEDRMSYVEPANATIVNPDPIALLKGAPHRELAIRFIEFLLSPAAQKIWIVKAGAPGGPKLTSLFRLPIVRTTYADRTGFTAKDNPFEHAATFNTSPARKKTFSILGELIQASCMDLLDELRETRRAILASPKAAELDAQLGRFPFDQKEALQRLDAYKKADPLKRLEMQRQWTTDFREEYRKLREAARS